MPHLAYTTPATYPHVAALDPLPWMAYALCAEVDPELWFSESDRGSRWQAARAKAICADCPVRRRCLKYGMGDHFGIYGGLTPAERQRLRGAS